MASTTRVKEVIIRSRRELEPYSDLILELLGRGMNFNDLPTALAERGIYASEKIVRSVREGLHQRRNIRRDHKERMIGIYRKWKGRDIVIKYEGKIQTFAKLKRTIDYKGKKYRLDEEDLIKLEAYTGPTPKEIYYFDPNDPNTNLLEADGCDWDPAEKDEALHYNFGNQAEDYSQVNLQVRLLSSSQGPSDISRTTSPLDSRNGPNEAHESKLLTSDAASQSLWEWVGIAHDHTGNPSRDKCNTFRDLMLSLYAKRYGNMEYDPQRMATMSEDFLDHGMLDDAETVTSAAVSLTEKLYGSTNAQTLLATVHLANVRTRQGRFREAHQIGAAAVKGLKNVLGDYDQDVLKSECYLCEILLELEQLDSAKTLCCDVLDRSIAGINVSYEVFDLFKLQLAKICNAQSDYLEAKKILEAVVRDRDYRLGFCDERTLRASVELVYSLLGLGDWEAATRASKLECEIERRESLGVPREIWTLELVHSVGVQLYDLGAHFEAEKVFRGYFDCLHGMIRSSSHPRLLCAEAWIASCLNYQGKGKEASAIYSRLLKPVQDTWGPHHRITLLLMFNEAWAMSEETPFTVFEARLLRVRDLRSEYLGEDHPDTLESRRCCAYAQTIRGEWDEALAALEKIQEAEKKRSNRKGRVELLDTLREICHILCGRRQDSRAESLLRQALDLGKHLFGPGHPRALSPLRSLVLALASLGRFSEGEDLLFEGMSTLTGSLGKEHYQVMELKRVEAQILGFQNKYADAAEIQLGVLKQYTESYGDEHPYVILVAGELASSYAELEMVKEAQTLFEKAIKACQSTFGHGHRRTCDLEFSLARMFRDQRNLTKALELGHAIMEVAQSSFGTIEAKSGISTSYVEHPFSLPFIEALAITYTTLGDITSSVKLSKRILELRTRLQGPNHPDTISSLSNLAIVYTTAGEYLAAEQICHDTVQRSTATFGDSHARTTKAMLYHGRALRGLRRYAESMAMFNKLLDGIFKRSGECHSDVAEIYEDIALLFYDQGRYDEAVEYLNHALRVYTKLKNKSVVGIMIDICTCYIAMNAYSKAELQAEETVREAEKILGRHHPETIQARIEQVSALLENEKYADVDNLANALCQDIESREGKNSARVLRVENISGRSLLAQGRINEAEAFLESCINLRSHKDPRDPGMFSLILLLSDVKENLGQLDEKEAILQDLLDRLEIRNSSDPSKESLEFHLTIYTDVMEALAQTRVSLHEYESAEYLMRKVLGLRIAHWGEGSQQACVAERLLARCIPENRLMARLKLQEELLIKYWPSTGLDMESSVPLLIDMADTCSGLGEHEYEVAIRERILDLKPYPTDLDQQFVYDFQKLTLARYEIGQLEAVEENLESLEKIIRLRFPRNLRDLAWTLQLLAMAKHALGNPGAAALALERSLLAGTQNPTELISDNLERLDLLVNLNMELSRWQEAKNAWIALLALREEANQMDWPISTDQLERLNLIEENIGSPADLIVEERSEILRESVA